MNALFGFTTIRITILDKDLRFVRVNETSTASGRWLNGDHLLLSRTAYAELKYPGVNRSEQVKPVLEELHNV